MALTNLIVTVVGVTAAVLLLRSDVKQSASIFRRNVRHIRQWLEEESASASKFGFRLWAITDRHMLCLLCEDGIKYACWNRRVGGIRMWVGAFRMRKMLLMVVAAGVITDCGLREAVQGWRRQEISSRCMSHREKMEDHSDGGWGKVEDWDVVLLAGLTMSHIMEEGA